MSNELPCFCPKSQEYETLLESILDYFEVLGDKEKKKKHTPLQLKAQRYWLMNEIKEAIEKFQSDQEELKEE